MRAQPTDHSELLHIRPEEYKAMQRTISEQQAEIRRLTEWLMKIAGPWSDFAMQSARTLHWDMRGWAQQALDGMPSPAEIRLRTRT